jgi:hypothetical protein
MIVMMGSYKVADDSSPGAQGLPPGRGNASFVPVDQGGLAGSSFKHVVAQQ